MLEGVPTTLRGDVNQRVLAYLRERSAHDEVAFALIDAVAPLGDVQTFSPDPRQYRYVAAATQRVVFAFAAGQRLVGFRLRSELVERALVTGAEPCPQVGPQWVAFTLFRDDWPVPDLRFWARKAYDDVRRGSIAP